MKKIALFLIFLLSISKIGFCECAPTSVQKEYEHSDYVFTGEVIKIEGSQETKAKIFFDVTKQFKGAPVQSAVVIRQGCLYSRSAFSQEQNAYGGASCGVEDVPLFEQGKQYLVCANGVQDQLAVFGCSLTKILSDMAESEYLELQKLSQQ